MSLNSGIVIKQCAYTDGGGSKLDCLTQRPPKLIWMFSSKYEIHGVMGTGCVKGKDPRLRTCPTCKPSQRVASKSGARAKGDMVPVDLHGRLGLSASTSAAATDPKGRFSPRSFHS